MKTNIKTNINYKSPQILLSKFNILDYILLNNTIFVLKKSGIPIELPCQRAKEGSECIDPKCPPEKLILTCGLLSPPACPIHGEV